MNIRMIKNVLGWLLLFETAFLLVPTVTALVYGEREVFSFLLTAAICAAVGILFIGVGRPRTTLLFAREGFLIVALSWILLSLFGCLPFVFSKAIPSFTDALFETVSGFTTTGASILSDVESLPRSVLMWRSFTHWVGGMGVLVFMLAFLPLSGGQNMHIMQAESPGPSVSKLVPRVRTTALLLYSIYLALTVLEFVFLLCGGIGVFEALNTAFATAGTGGFGLHNDSIGGYSAYVQIVVAVFMLLFAVNFNSYFFLLRRKWREIFSTEVLVFLAVVAVATISITLNIRGLYATTGEGARASFFTVASLISSTGFSTTDFDLWPTFSRFMLVILMFMGACAGSTGGGLKVSRVILFFKGVARSLRVAVHPKQVKRLSVDGQPVDETVVRSVFTYIGCFAAVFAVSMLLLTPENLDLTSTFTAVLTTLNNMGPGLGAFGPTQNFGFLSGFSKFVLMFDMLAGRLELFPMLVLFSPATYKK